MKIKWSDVRDSLPWFVAICGIVVVVVMTIVGALHESPKTQRLSQQESDYTVLNIMAAAINAQQTNWTVIIVPRTNAP